MKKHRAVIGEKPGRNTPRYSEWGEVYRRVVQTFNLSRGKAPLGLRKDSYLREGNPENTLQPFRWQRAMFSQRVCLEIKGIQSLEE